MTLARNEAFETKNHLIYGNNVKYFTDEEIKTIIEKINAAIGEHNKITNY